MAVVLRSASDTTQLRTESNIVKTKDPYAELLRELALEDRELLKMLASDGRYKPVENRPGPSVD